MWSMGHSVLQPSRLAVKHNRPSLSTWAGVHSGSMSLHHVKGCGMRGFSFITDCVPRVLDEFELQLHQQVSATRTRKEA